MYRSIDSNKSTNNYINFRNLQQHHSNRQSVTERARRLTSISKNLRQFLDQDDYYNVGVLSDSVKSIYMRDGNLDIESQYKLIIGQEDHNSKLSQLSLSMASSKAFASFKTPTVLRDSYMIEQEQVAGGFMGYINLVEDDVSPNFNHLENSLEQEEEDQEIDLNYLHV